MLTPDFAPDPTDRQDFFHISASFYNNTMQPNTILDSVGCSQFTISGLFRNLNPKRWWLFSQLRRRAVSKSDRWRSLDASMIIQTQQTVPHMKADIFS